MYMCTQNCSPHCVYNKYVLCLLHVSSPCTPVFSINKTDRYDNSSVYTCTCISMSWIAIQFIQFTIPDTMNLNIKHLYYLKNSILIIQNIYHSYYSKKYNKYVLCLLHVSSPCTPVFSINKTDRYDITEILLKVALNTITLTGKTTRNFIGDRHWLHT
jgi:hypothetical protein